MKVAVGVGLICAGLVMVYGGMTGNLAAMIAALVQPSSLRNR